MHYLQIIRRCPLANASRFYRGLAKPVANAPTSASDASRAVVFGEFRVPIDDPHLLTLEHQLRLLPEDTHSFCLWRQPGDPSQLDQQLSPRHIVLSGDAQNRPLRDAAVDSPFEMWVCDLPTGEIVAFDRDDLIVRVSPDWRTFRVESVGGSFLKEHVLDG